MNKTKMIVAFTIAAAFYPVLSQAGSCSSSTSCPPVDVDWGQIITNSQAQSSDVTSNQNANVGTSTDSTFSSTAAGNSLSVGNQATNVSVDNTQTLSGNVTSNNDVSVITANGTTTITGVAQGNAGQSQGCCSYTGVNNVQDSGSGNISSSNTLTNTTYADDLVSSSQAVGNNWATAAENSNIYNYSSQTGSANVSAKSTIDICCNNNSTTSQALAAGNTMSLAGSNSTINSDLIQNSAGTIDSYSHIAQDTGKAISSSATSIANNTTITNQYGYASLNTNQASSGANVNSLSEVVVNDWAGNLISSAASTGNAALVSNIGSDVNLTTDQQNDSSIFATSNLTGASSSGGVGYAYANATGNTVTGYSCSGCSVNGVTHVNGSNIQTNNGDVSSTVNIDTSTSGAIYSSASAIGNSATFMNQKSN